MKYLNLGCGSKVVEDGDWDNIDFRPANYSVKKVNILKGLPYADSSVDAVYSSHMLEHFNRYDAQRHIEECYRVLKRGGIVRICVPNLENICREYLRMLDNVRTDVRYEDKYDYEVIELIDQMTRRTCGGEMDEYWASHQPNDEYVLKRSGYPEGYVHPNLRKKCNSFLSACKKLVRKLPIVQSYFRLRFINSGENHLWMYDSYSLTRLLNGCGFRNISVKDYNVSNILNWREYGLEVNAEGTEYKPNSLYVEAVK